MYFNSVLLRIILSFVYRAGARNKKNPRKIHMHLKLYDYVLKNSML
jgi:hypothetical protein